VILSTLKSFGVSATLDKYIPGAAVTRFEIFLDEGVDVRRVETYKTNIAMKLKSGEIRVVVPIKGTEAFGIEVPNAVFSTVGLKQILIDFDKNNPKLDKRETLVVPIGQDLYGKYLYADITKMPHVLIAGATGKGKSVGMNVIINSILYNYSPDDVRMILIDPKQVEFAAYSHMPHLLLAEAVTDIDKIINVMDWCIAEMQRRYKLMKEVSRTSNVADHNKCVPEEERLYKIVIIIDELADIISVLSNKFEEKVQRLARLARAAGIHLIVATQRPSADVVTGEIKANLPARIAYQVSSSIDSRVILDEMGAELLLGRGDLLYRDPSESELVRLKCPMITANEIRNVVEDVKRNNEAYFDEQINAAIYTEKEEPQSPGEISKSDKDEKEEISLKKAVFACLAGNGASISFLQRRLGYGYPKAARVFDRMESLNFLGQLDPSTKTRVMLITRNEAIEIFGDPDDDIM